MMNKKVIILIVIILVSIFIIAPIVIYNIENNKIHETIKKIAGESIMNECFKGYCIEKDYNIYSNKIDEYESYTSVEPMIIKSKQELESNFLKPIASHISSIQECKLYIKDKNGDVSYNEFFTDNFFENYNVIVFSYEKLNERLEDIIITKNKNNKIHLSICIYKFKSSPLDYIQTYVFIKVNKNITDFEIDNVII